ncbi:MAG: ABC transporter ATP-binding protein [Acidimicrobiales bacterium]
MAGDGPWTAGPVLEPPAAADPNDVPVIEFNQVSRVFPGPPVVEALRSADLIVDRGQYLAVIGPSGSGKSTMLNLLGLLDRPTSGRYRLNGLDTSELTEAERAGLRASEIGFVFQSFHLLGSRTNVENVMLSEVYRPGGEADRRERSVAALRAVGLGHRLDGNPTTLSGGERQRVAVARALVSSPSVLLADEPTGNLDTATGEQIMELFGQLHTEGLTVVRITHDPTVARRAERVVRIQDGILTAETGAGVAAGSGRRR